MGTQGAGGHMAGADWDISEGTWGHGGDTTERAWGHRRQGWEHGQKRMGTSPGRVRGQRDMVGGHGTQGMGLRTGEDTLGTCRGHSHHLHSMDEV